MTSVFDESLFSDEYRKEREKALQFQRILFWIIVAISFVAGYLYAVVRP